MPLLPQISAIPYQADSAGLFAAIRHLPYAIWLDSGHPGSGYGRYDIISAAPDKLLITRGDTSWIRDRDGRETRSSENPFTLLARLLPQDVHYTGDLPFCGGALGYLGYDLARQLERLPMQAAQDIDHPDLCVGFYSWAAVQDHEQGLAWLVTLPGFAGPEIVESLWFHDLMSTHNEIKKPFRISRFRANIEVDKYAKDVQKIQDYIAAGDCYQVNYAQRFDTEYEGDPFTAYLTLRQALPSPFSAYMQLDQGALLCLSPERFVRVQQGLADTQPIKGTIKRGDSPAEDRHYAESLQASLKDRAENLMIVDLLRNDLSKTCDQVRVPALFELQSFANVHHLVSTVTGKLKPGASALDLLRGSFPGGSITGAPKIRAMEIIEELEPSRRSVYCGSLGYISAQGNMDTNIAIRTLVCDRGKIYCWGGGGIVADSEVDKEYQESIAKVKVLLDTLEQEFSDSRQDSIIVVKGSLE